MADNENTPSRFEAMCIAGFVSVALYNAVTVVVLVFTIFKRYSGLYFWSLLVAASGIPITTAGELLKIFQNGPIELALILATVGWYFMVTGQSVVLYSRLHLVEPAKHRLRWVLGLIIVDFFLFQVGMSIFYFPANIISRPNVFWQANQIYEKIQVTAFTLQESIIAGIYIFWTWKMLAPDGNPIRHKERQLIKHLIAVNVFVILLQFVLIATEYANLYNLQTTFKSAVYSIQLVLEFSVLNKLRELVRPEYRLPMSPSFQTRNSSIRKTEVADFASHIEYQNGQAV